MSNLENENRRIGESDASEKSLGMIVASDTFENAETVLTTVPATHDPKALDAHARAGHELIPLRHWKAKDAKGKPAGKEPVGRWRRDAALTLEEAVLHMKAGNNIGVRLRDTDLVIDVDPRHFKENDNPLVRLKADFGLPEMPFVKTGGGGLHLYLRKRAEVVISYTLASYPGIEFASLGRYVVAAGSIHPDSGKPYSHDDDPLARMLSEATEAPTVFLDAIKKHSASATADTSGEITREQLAKLLSKLDVTTYNGRHNDWFKIMASCHHATGGSGVEEFVAWSISDVSYADDDEEIRKRWRSLSHKPDSAKIGTLRWALLEAGHGAWVDEVLLTPANQDFPDDLPMEIARPMFLEKKGKIEANYRNTQRAIESARLGVGYDELSQRPVLRAERLPWSVDIGRELTDDLIRIVREWIMEQFGFEPRREDVSDVLFALATKNTFNPVVDFLDDLNWDGVSRVDRLFPDYFGSPDSEYERAVGRILLLAAVRRMRKPGTKFDTVPIIEGKQGSGKTSALRILGRDWHSDAELGRVDGKDAAGVLHDVWIMELGELTAMNKAEVDHLKAFVSRCEDRYRPPYGKMVKTYPRRCVFVGTTNSGSYLRDSTGNRRYLPVSTGVIDLDALRRDRDQLWAEASVLEMTGESLVMPSLLWDAAADKQGDRLVNDPWLDNLSSYLATSSTRTRISSRELLEFGLEVPCSRQNQNDAKRVAVLMAKLGWQHKGNLRVGSQSGTGYISPEDPLFKAS
jgi:predicted P-loop ATPase